MGDEHIKSSVTALRSKDEPARLAAIQRLGASDVPPSVVVPHLVAALNDASIEVSTAAAVALKGIGEGSIPQLVQIIENDDADEDVRAYAADAVGDLGKVGLPTLMRLAEGPDSTIRMMAIEAIPRAGEAGEAATPMLAKALHDPEVLDSAAIALAQLAKTRLPGTGEKIEALDVLLSSCKDENVNVRRSAVSALRFLGDKVSCVTSTLEDVSRDSDETVRDTAAEILGKIETK